MFKWNIFHFVYIKLQFITEIQIIELGQTILFVYKRTIIPSNEETNGATTRASCLPLLATEAKQPLEVMHQGSLAGVIENNFQN